MVNEQEGTNEIIHCNVRGFRGAHSCLGRLYGRETGGSPVRGRYPAERRNPANDRWRHDRLRARRDVADSQEPQSLRGVLAQSRRLRQRRAKPVFRAAASLPLERRNGDDGDGSVGDGYDLQVLRHLPEMKLPDGAQLRRGRHVVKHDLRAVLHPALGRTAFLQRAARIVEAVGVAQERCSL